MLTPDCWQRVTNKRHPSAAVPVATSGCGSIFPAADLSIRPGTVLSSPAMSPGRRGYGSSWVVVWNRKPM